MSPWPRSRCRRSTRTLGVLLGLGLASACGPRGSDARAPGSSGFRLALCTEPPLQLEGLPGARQSRACAARYTQNLSDPAHVQRLGADRVERRFLVYAPDALPERVPVVFVFPGYGASAETAAFYYTHTRFETLADRHGFVVVYGNGVSVAPPGEAGAPYAAQGGYLQGCLAPHSGVGLDVQYTREILDRLEVELPIDRARVYATGFSAGGGLCLQLALEAPELVAAIAPVAPLPFQPRGPWLRHCQPRPDHGRVSIALLAATHDPFIAYEPGPSVVYPSEYYPGMEHTRDVWLAAMGIHGPARVHHLPDVVSGDSYQPHTGMDSSFIERHHYPSGPDGQEFWYYKAVGMGHWWPSPKPMWERLWPRFGKANRDIDFADHAWEFFSRHSK